MDITPAIPSDRKVIDSYGPGRFQIAEEVWQGSVIVLPNQVLSWEITAVDQIDAEAFAAIHDTNPPLEVLLLGTGATAGFVKPSIRREIRAAAGLAVDLMDTGAACRTYNILLSEGRRVAAALIAV